MDITDLVPLIESLDDNVDDLEEALEPLLQSALSDTAGKLPLLDKAELYVLVTYAIESILFSYLRLNGVNSKEHPVFRELARVKQYFEKIKAADFAGTKQNMTLDKAAAGRFVRHALVGNQNFERDPGMQSGNDNAARHILFEVAPSKPTGSEPANRPRAVALIDDPNSDPEHMETSDGTSLKRPGGRDLAVEKKATSGKKRRRSMK